MAIANYKFPGVYASIRDLSGVTQMNTTTACGYVGEAAFGPVFTPYHCGSLRDYVDNFGPLNSKYGYAGYSLAVASESITDHYFVRVVPTEDDVDLEKENSDTSRAIPASYGRYVVLTNRVKTASEKTTTRNAIANADDNFYFNRFHSYEEIRDSGTAELRGDYTIIGTTPSNKKVAFVIGTTFPSSRSFYISVKEDSINDNPSYGIVDISKNEAGTILTLVLENTTGNQFFVADDTVSLNGFNDTEANTNYSKLNLNNVKIVSSSLADGKETITINTTNASYVDDELIRQIQTPEERTAGIQEALKYKDRTFSVAVREKVSKNSMPLLETFSNCTLFQNKDAYGSSTFIEDVINGSSNYIQVFSNYEINNAGTDEEQFENFPEEIELELLAGNSNGKWDDDAKQSDALIRGWDVFSDRTQVQVSLLLNSGYTTPAYQNKMLEIAEKRRDCFCLFDIPMTKTEKKTAEQWRKNVQGINSYRAAIFSPWIRTFDSAQGRANFVMCPSAYIAKIMGSTSPWLAPAGLNRGILSSATVTPSGLTQHYDSTEGGELYTDYQINCIIKNPAAGYVNWGQRTLQIKQSALDRINVARTVIYIETVLRDAAKWHLFENNTPYERLQLTLQFQSFLNTILSADGIQRFEVICDETNNTPQVIANNQMCVDIYLWPSYTAEYILLSTTVEGSDTTVDITTNL